MNGAMPQGSGLGPLSFLVYLYDMVLTPGVLTHKYVDDTTLSEGIKDPENSNLQTAANSVEAWSKSNMMRVNTKKTKEMVIDFTRKPREIDPLILSGSVTERVSVFKLLGVWISNDLTWEHHIHTICSKVSPRLYYLKQLKRSGLSKPDLITYYKTIIRPVTDYACPVWHPGLTKAQSESLEQLQKRALRMIYPGEHYCDILEMTEMDRLSERREHMCEKFFKSMCESNSKLNYLLPEKRNSNYDLRKHLKFPLPKIKNERYRKDFVIYSLFNYQ